MTWFVIGLADPPQLAIVGEPALAYYLSRGWVQLADGVSDKSVIELDDYAPPAKTAKPGKEKS